MTGESGGGLGRLYRQVIQHSAVYGVGQVLTRLATVALLPLYTRYLDPAAYGVQAILDLLGSLIAIVVASGFTSAAARLHFEHEGDAWKARVWWTATWALLAASVAVTVPMWLSRGWIARHTLGAATGDGSVYLALFLPAIVSGSIEYLLGVYLRVEKASVLFVALSFGRLVVNIGLNVFLIVGMGFGLSGLLLGNLLASVLAATIQVGVFARRVPPVWVDRVLLQEMWQYGWPLVGAGLLATLMHQADRYILLQFVSLEDVGVYSLAYQIGQGLNALLLLPFASIWSVVIFEIAKRPEAEEVYAEVFKYFTYGLAFVFMGVSLFAVEFLRLLTTEQFWRAAPLVPVICFGYLFFSLHDHFRIPALLARKTAVTLWVMAVATALNVVANAVLVPMFGISGAAWATALSFAVFAGGGLHAYRQIARYPYDLKRTAAAVCGMGVTVLLLGSYNGHTTRVEWPYLLMRATAVTIWAFVLFREPWHRFRRGMFSGTTGPVVVGGSGGVVP